MRRHPGLCGVAGLLLALPLNAVAQPRPAAPPPAELASPSQAGWLVDARTGCWVWAPRSPAGSTVSWSGACPRGPAEGPGSSELRRPGVATPPTLFTGTRREGRREGPGTTLAANGSRYEGEYRADLRHGQGVLVSADGHRYEGGWQDGRRQGQGVYTWPTGLRYEGEFRDNQAHGRGVLTWPNGDRYEGEFQANRPHGRGALTTSDGILAGVWNTGCYRDSLGRATAIGGPVDACPP